MKKLILTAAIAATLSTGAFAVGSTKNTVKESKVSFQVQNQFDTQFQDAENVSWSNTANGQKADFIIDDVKMTAFYDNRGQYIGSTQNVEFKKLPSAAKKEIADKYKGYEVGEVIKFQSNEPATSLDRLVGYTDPIAYFVDLKNDKEEMLVRVTPQANVYFYKQIK